MHISVPTDMQTCHTVCMKSMKAVLILHALIEIITSYAVTSKRAQIAFSYCIQLRLKLTGRIIKSPDSILAHKNSVSIISIKYLYLEYL